MFKGRQLPPACFATTLLLLLPKMSAPNEQLETNLLAITSHDQWPI